MSLFRTEVQVAQGAQWLGTVRLGAPVSFTIATGVALALAALLVAFCCVGELSRKARMSGVLVPQSGSMNIVPGQSGVISDRRVAEGQRVAAGDVLLVLDTERQSLAGPDARLAQAQIEARLASLAQERDHRIRQAHEQQVATIAKSDSLAAEVRQARAELELRRQRLQLGEADVERDATLAREGFLSQGQLRSREGERLDLAMQVQGLQRNITELERQWRASQAERAESEGQLSVALSQLDRDTAIARQEASDNLARRTLAITAPRPGMVTGLNLQVGQAVQAGQTVATLVADDAALQAQVYAPSRSAGFLKLGQPVFLKYAAYPAEKFGLQTGTIDRISKTPFIPSELSAAAGQPVAAMAGTGEAVYVVDVRLDRQTIALYGRPQPLRPGMTLDADVEQERRKVWEWIVEPLLAART